MVKKSKRITSLLLAVIMVLSLALGTVPPNEAYAAETVNVSHVDFGSLQSKFPNVFKEGIVNHPWGSVLRFWYKDVKNVDGTTFTNASYDWSIYGTLTQEVYNEQFTVNGNIGYCFDITTPASGSFVETDLDSIGVQDQGLAETAAKVAYALTKDNFKAFKDYADKLCRAYASGNIVDTMGGVSNWTWEKADLVSFLESDDADAIAFKRMLVQYTIWTKMNQLTTYTGVGPEEGYNVSGGDRLGGTGKVGAFNGDWSPNGVGIGAIFPMDYIWSVGLDVWGELEASGESDWGYDLGVHKPGTVLDYTGVQGERIYKVYEKYGYLGTSGITVTRSGDTTAVTITDSAAAGTYDWQSIFEFDEAVIGSKPYAKNRNGQFIIKVQNLLRGKTKIGVISNGYVKVVKTSSDPSVTNGNSSYSLKDAVFGIYKTQAEANAATNASRGNPAAVLTTKEDGTTDPAELSPGKYYVKELAAPKGFSADTVPKEITIESDKTSTVTFADIPTFDPVGILLRKLDKQTGTEVGHVA